MRNTIHNALANAREIASKTAGQIRQGNTLSDDEMLHRYVAIHRGNPLGMATFVMGNRDRFPDGTDPMNAMRQYEQSMEDLMKARGL